jgi:hypothetical protein
MGIKGTHTIVRDAGTGRIVKPGEAIKRPNTTVTETVPNRGKGKK